MKTLAILFALMTPFVSQAQYRHTKQTVEGVEVYRLFDDSTHTLSGSPTNRWGR
jgi:hypothetical protein